MRRRVMVIGLDCLEPSLAFGRYRRRMPNLQRIAAGASGRLESICPPITCPAWMCAYTGRDPGQLGVYGFRNRAAWDYGPLKLTFSDGIPMETAPAAWDLAGAAGLHSTIIGVPPGYPPRAVRGEFIGCFMTPGDDSPFAHPAALIDETRALVGSYRFDVDDARSPDRRLVLDQILEMTNKRWRLAAHLLESRDPDLFGMVEIGTDRAHHAFWQFMDPRHVLYEADSPFERAIAEYYALVDRHIGELLRFVDDQTLVICLSDHGAQRMDGGFLINEWLLTNGYLRLRPGAPERPGRLRPADVDWEATTAWGDGGYYGRIFLNVAGREPAGRVPQAQVGAVRRELAAALRAVRFPWGTASARNRVYIPERIYREVRGFAPDLILYPGDLYWRALAGFASTPGEVFSRTNDTGPDGANHARFGCLAAISGATLAAGDGPRRQLTGRHLVDLAPTVLAHLGLPAPADIVGQALDPTSWLP